VSVGQGSCCASSANRRNEPSYLPRATFTSHAQAFRGESKALLKLGDNFSENLKQSVKQPNQSRQDQQLFPTPFDQERSKFIFRHEFFAQSARSFAMISVR
jgi:hypothetical protein